MDATHPTDGEQARLWNGHSGRAWVRVQAVLDRMLDPFVAPLLEGLPAGGRVLDVGCGTGATSLAAARRLGPDGGCVGVDVSEPMIEAARDRARREGASVDFVRADAQGHPFEPAAFDGIRSRFGVMFFDDPVRAFANLRSAAKPGAGLRFVAWRSPAENPFMTLAERTAAPLLPDLPPRRPGAPGQFAFADPDRVRTILAESGWTGIDLRPLDLACTFPEPGLMDYLTWLGPVGQALQAADPGTRARVVEALRAAFAPYVHGSEVRFTAACWIAEARAPGG